MAPDRATKEIKTTDGHTVVIKTYLTYREMAPTIKLGDDTIAKKRRNDKKYHNILMESLKMPLKDLLIFQYANYTEVGKEVTQMIKDDFLAAK